VVGKTAVIIAAAGSGTRMNLDQKKQYLKLKGKPILIYTIEKFEFSNFIDLIIPVVPETEVDYCRNLFVNGYGFKKVHKVVPGGEERQSSVLRGLNYIKNDRDLEIVLIHDGVRPFVDEQLIERSVKTAKKYGSAVPAVRVKDTIKEVHENDKLHTLKREDLRAVQTPQAFKKDIIIRAYNNAISNEYYATDDSFLVERQGKKIKLIEGSDRNIKITTPMDLIIAETFLQTANCQ